MSFDAARERAKMERYLGAIRRKWEHAIRQGWEVGVTAERDEVPVAVSADGTQLCEPGPEIRYRLAIREIE